MAVCLQVWVVLQKGVKRRENKLNKNNIQTADRIDAESNGIALMAVIIMIII